MFDLLRTTDDRPIIIMVLVPHLLFFLEENKIVRIDQDIARCAAVTIRTSISFLKHKVKLKPIMPETRLKKKKE